MTRELRDEPSFVARIVARRPLLYTAGAVAQLDRPGHVRAGSAIARVRSSEGARYFVVQDDANFIAVIDPRGHVDAITLPAREGLRQFDDGRGNKKHKLDLEACIVADDASLLIAFGSGSSNARETVVLVHGPTSHEPRVTTIEARELYAAMRRERPFCGAELNVEGAAVVGDDVVFLQRGNGAPVPPFMPVDASARVAREALVAYLEGRGACPPLRAVRAYDLGTVDGVRLTFTDACAIASGKLAFLACAEASPDAVRDGPVHGVALGVLDDVTGHLDHGLIADEGGGVLRDKAEGLAIDGDDPTLAWVVLDRDDPHAPAELLTIRLDEAFVRRTVAGIVEGES